MESILPGKYDLRRLRPKIKGQMILFPVSVKHEYVVEDGRSLGYPVDDGWVTIVSYDFTVGTLTEDTIALWQSIKEPSPPRSEIACYDWPEEELDKWAEGLNTEWAEKRFEDYRKEGLVDEDCKAEWIKNELENYHSWPLQWQDAYNQHRERLNNPFGETKVILKNGSLTLLKDDQDDYFFITKHHNHGLIQKADRKDAERYIKNAERYQKKLEIYKKKRRALRKNLRVLVEDICKEDIDLNI